MFAPIRAVIGKTGVYPVAAAGSAQREVMPLLPASQPTVRQIAHMKNGLARAAYLIDFLRLD
jgi:hypothetical protein